MISALAANRYGVVSRQELLAAGLSTSMIDDRVAKRRLLRLYPGVYAVGHAALRPEGHQLAAVLAGGPGAVLSHRSAADAWGLRPSARARHEITVTADRGRRLPSLDAHRHRLAAADVTELSAIPITTVARTLLDLAEVVPADHLDRALLRAVQLRLYDGRALDDTIDRCPRHRGRRALAAALERLRPDAAATRSELERRMLALVAEHGLPRPRVNQTLAGCEVDLLWPTLRIAVELDGHAFHATPEAFEGDRRRDVQLTAAGYRVLRFTWRQVTGDPDWVVSRLRDVLRPASAPAAPPPPTPPPARAGAAA